MFQKHFITLVFFWEDLDRALLESDRTTRYEMVAAGLGYALSCKLPEHVDRQYGFRSIPLGNLEYRLITVSNPIRAAEPEIQRFLTLLEEEVSQV